MTSTSTERPGANQAALSIDVEDWFHAENLKIAREAWDQCELRVARNTTRMMEILDQANARATFFVLGWVAEKCPWLVRAIAAAGHEVASHGYEHKLVYSLTPHEFRADVVRSKKYLEDLIGRPVRGYRAPCFSITDWAIPILQDVGFDYDSSVVPTFAHDRYGRLSGVSAADPIVMLRDGFHEAGVSCIPIGTRGLPWGGGGYFRLVPFRLWCEGMRTILRTGRPYIFYIHPWEIDPGQPHVRLSIGRRFRHRINLGRCEARFAALCKAFQWMPVCDLLDRRKLESGEAARAEAIRSVVAAAADAHARIQPHVLCIGGDDHHLRIPFMLALRDEGFRVSAAGPGDPAPFARAGIDHHRFRLARFVSPIADAMSLRAIRKIIADVRPELVHCFDTKLNMLVPLASRDCSDVQAISTVNGLGWLYSSRSAMAVGLRPVYRTLQRLAAHWTAATIFQNRDDQTFFARHRMLGTGRHLVIAGAGIDIKRFEAATRGSSPRELRAALGLESAEVVVTVARMTREKGIPTLLTAAALVHECRPSVRFLLVGPRASEGPWAVTEAEIDRHAPYVIAIGPRSDIPALLGIADVFAFPTEYREGVPRAVLEAALAGAPIVATDLPGCRDVVRDGITGLLVPPSSPTELAERILSLLRDRATARAMGARAKELVRREFGLQLVTERHAAVYRELLGRSARRRVHLTDEAGMTIRSTAMPL